MVSSHQRWRAMFTLAALCLAADALAQESSIRTQCPTSTPLHPTGDGVKCASLTGGDGMVTMADGNPLYVFGFAPVPGGGPVANTPEYPGWVMENGVLAANAPAPTIAVDEDDELFLTLTNVGMTMRPDLFDAHSIHWHGFPQAASVFDGEPEASLGISMGASITYYYLVKQPGTYLYHCHVEATEHMQMGMLGNLYVRPKQNKLPDGTTFPNGYVHHTGDTYVYNDNDGSTAYDKEYPIQIATMDRNFHEASFSVQPLPFASMKDTYFLLNGRGYPDTTNPGVLSTVDPLGKTQYSQPVSSLIEATAGEKILLRISNVSVTQYSTLGTNGIPMRVVGMDARLLRDDAGANTSYVTHSLTLGGGESADVILDTAGIAPGTYFLYTTNLHQLANDAENFGGMMTEIRIQ